MLCTLFAVIFLQRGLPAIAGLLVIFMSSDVRAILVIFDRMLDRISHLFLRASWSAVGVVVPR